MNALSFTPYRRSARYSLSLVAFAAVFVMGGAAAQAAEKPPIRLQINQNAVWDSNPLMVRQDEESIYGSETRVSLGYQREFLTGTAVADFSVLRNQFNDSTYNSNDFYARTQLEKTFDKWRLGLNANYDLDTARTSEITTFGRDVGTGRRNAFMLQPSSMLMLTPRSGVGFSARWQENRYDTDTLTNYKIVGLTPSYEYKLTPLQVLNLSLNAQRYTLLDNRDQYIDSIGPTLAWRYNFSPLWTMQLSGGQNYSKIKGYEGTESKWDGDIVYGASLLYENERHKTILSALRSRQPYANGTEAYLTTFEAGEKFQANERLALEFKGNYQFSEGVPQGSNNLDTAWGGNASLNYAIGMRWFVSASYKYREEELTNTADPAKQQIAKIGLTYRFGYNP